ncbi:MAG: orotidine-5'-phosphate decarboxylase [Gemmatimonadota bacterium]|nr:orotidine-5'-phosphate decarboxylase [Gemmatimonadota bacterium]
MAVRTARAIVALDRPDARSAMDLVGRIGKACDFYKVGNELFTAAGPQIVEALRALGKSVFLDLKLHDIPNTVGQAASRAASIGASLLTVHATGGREMMQAAVSGGGDKCGILAVTILTSLDTTGVRLAWGRARLDLSREVLRLAGQAADAGTHGVVCSGLEALSVNGEYGERLRLLVPGIRRPGDPRNDQRRTVTPLEAVRAGASYIVLGRTVTADPDPAMAMRYVNKMLAEKR